MWWAMYVARIREGKGADRILVGIPEGRRPLARPRCRCDDNITMDLQEKEMDGACSTYGRLGDAYTIFVGRR